MNLKLVGQLIVEIEELKKSIKEIEKTLTDHLIESTGIKADIRWLKWLNMLIVAGLITLWFKG